MDSIQGGDPLNMIRNMGTEDMKELRRYICAADHKEYNQLADGWVQLSITHSNLKQQILQQRLSLHSTILEIKQKLYHHCGTSPGYMQMVLRSQSGMGAADVCVMDDDSKKLGYYSPQNGMYIHIVDKDPNSLAKTGWLENVNLVQKYKISEEDYDKRENSVRNYKRVQKAKDPNYVNDIVRNKANGVGRTAEGDITTNQEGKENVNFDSPGADTVEGMEVGMRCEVQPGARRGVVQFVGEAQTDVKNIAPGYWVGVQFDEPLGMNDGSVNGVRYFECPDRHGGFVRGGNIAVGDYPEVDPFASDSDDEL
jgi:tubulin-folding cofactor B